MAHIRLDLDSPIVDGQTVTFRSPVNCAEIEGLIVYYRTDGEETSETFQFVDSHGNNVGGVDLFASDVLVQVILDTNLKRAYVQNADTSKYLEEKLKLKNLFATGPIILVEGIHYGKELPTDNSPETVGRLFFRVVS